jgi:DNA transformation protein and related proteins
MSDAPVSTLRGIGPATQGWLEEAGIGTVVALRSIGAVEAYRRLKFMFPRNINLNALYALEAALRGCHWLDLPPHVKVVLQQEAKVIDEALRKGPVSRCSLGS